MKIENLTAFDNALTKTLSCPHVARCLNLWSCGLVRDSDVQGDSVVKSTM